MFSFHKHNGTAQFRIPVNKGQTRSTEQPYQTVSSVDRQKHQTAIDKATSSSTSTRLLVTLGKEIKKKTW
jgi:hypothetical protein